MSIARMVVLGLAGLGGVAYLDHKFKDKAPVVGGKIIEPGMIATAAVAGLGALVGVPADVLGPLVVGGVVGEAPKVASQIKPVADFFGLPYVEAPHVGKLAGRRVGVRFTDGELVQAIREQTRAAAPAPSV